MNPSWLEQCIQVHFGGRGPAEMEDLLSHPELRKFIKSPSEEPCYLVSSKNKRLSWKRTLDSEPFESCVAFYKKFGQGEPSGPQFHLVSVQQSPVASLYEAIHGVYNPILSKSEKWDKNTKLKALVQALDAELSYNVSLARNVGENTIISVNEELAYWKKKGGSVIAPLSALCEALTEIETKSLADCNQVSDKVHDALEELWQRFPEVSYPQERIDRLRDVLSAQLVLIIKRKWLAKDIMQEPFDCIKEELRCSIQLLEEFKDTMKNLNLTRSLNSGEDKRSHGVVEHPIICEFLGRLQEIWNLRSSCHLLLSFLSEEDLQDLQVKRIFSAFDAHKALESGIAFQQEWDTSLLSHKKALIPIENKVAKKLQTFLSSLQSQPSQLVREFQKFGDILGYENLSRQLESEKEVLLSHILSKLKLLKAAHQERIHQARNSFEDYQKQATVANITWTRQNLAKIHDYDTLISKIAKENIDYKKLSEESKELLNSYERELFEDWIQSTDTEELRELLDTHSAVHLLRFKFENGKLCTNYSDRLISLQRETRQLQSMGFSVPAHIRKAMELAQKHYRHNIVLKQVAHFYNTIDRQMLPYHQPMLLNLALQFEKLVKDSEALYKKASGNPQELEKYISLLQVTTDKLTSENRHLSKLHETIVEHVKTLMNVDLVKNQNRWKDIIALIRNIAYSVQERGISLESTLSWRNHIDHQIYKAFEFQYKLGLESLHEVLPEIKVDLVFKNQKLQYRPSYEEVRAKYYREIKKIVNLPSGFKTLGESDVFTRAIESNVFSMSLVYKRAEQLFQNVSKTLDAFKEWVVLGMVDLEKFVQENVKDVPDWEYNFKSLKVRGKYAEQIPSVIKVDCITVSTSSLKTTVDDHLQTLFDCLVNSLRKSIIDQYAVLDVFINKATTVLSIKPESMEDVTLASQKHKELSIEKLSLMPIFESSETKNKLLRTVSGTGIDGSQILAKWSKVELILESHELMMKEQLDVLRNAFEGRLSSFMNEMDKFEARWTHLKPKTSDMNQIGDALSAVTFLNEQRKEFSDLEAIADSLAADADLFGLSAPALNKRDTLLADINQTQEMWGICETFLGEVHVMAQEDWISFSAKNFLFEDFVAKWTNLLPKRPVDAITVHIKKELDSYQKFAPVLKYLKGDVWTPEHWSEFFHTFGKDRNLSLAKLTFGQLLDLKVDMIQRADKIRDLHARAQGEVTIREALQELDIWGASASFSLTPYIKVHGNSMTIIKEWKDLLAQIGDNQSLIQSLKDSSFYKRFLDRSSVWEQRFINLNDYLKQLNSIQRKWVYLEPLFSCGSLPDEHARFTKIDSDFTSIMDHISRDPLVLAFLDYPNVKSVLVTLHDQLERCQKALMEFLEKKRDHFARFYFIGDEDLLEILGQAKNPLVIQSHLKKLFAGVHSVQFDRDVKNIVAMCSIHGEVVPLKSPVQLSENVEIWLEEFSKEMKGSLLALLIKSVDTMDLFAVPQQIAGLVENIHFTRQVESIIERRGEFTALEQSLQSQLSKYSTFRGSAIEDKNARTVTELKIKSLMLDTLHNISIVKELKAAKATSVSDWVWRKQLRFYLNSGTNCVVRMNDAEFNYTFEYQGNYSNLAHTPLNDKCYLTLTQAMGAGFGGNPLGPAGTGKTESVKALGLMFGRQTLVFNCDEGIDYKSMGRIFTGLVKCGAWGCFDEFNRLEEAVLSAVSQQIQLIQAALKAKSSHITILGKNVRLDSSSGIFVTLNPAGKGYGGRQRLPDNLKQLFRTIAMTRPDNELIASTILYSEGFCDAQNLGGKVVALFGLCRQVLSAQQHYDFGLRPMKAALGFAGQLLQTERDKGPVSEAIEATLIVKSLLVSNLSKLTKSDSKQFALLVEDIFPGINHEELIHEELSKALLQSYQEMGLPFIKEQAEKVCQLYEACRQRTGVVIVGPSGSGKSTVWRLLKSAWQKLGQKIKAFNVNPKAIERHLLLGNMDADTREWTDGILTNAARQVVREPTDVVNWIICDGDVDPEWIESLNSVLDDNRLLTMASGERIQFGSNVNFIFETHDLRFASPATVSRMGMIYLSDEMISTEALLSAWILKNELSGSQMEIWVGEYVAKTLEWVIKSSGLVQAFSRSSLLNNCVSQVIHANHKEEFAVGVLRGLGVLLTHKTKLDFATFVMKLTGLAHHGERSSSSHLFFDQDSKKIEGYTFIEPNDLRLGSVIETPEAQVFMATIRTWLNNGSSILVTGPEGVGKSCILKHTLMKQRSATVITIHCSSRSRASHVLQRLYQSCISCQTNQGRVLRPKDVENIILYLEDLNLVKPDKYETVELVQFLQQVLSYQGFYDASLEWVRIEKIQVVVSMNPSSSPGRYSLSARFLAHFKQCFMAPPGKEQLLTVTRVQLKALLNRLFHEHPIWSSSNSVQKLSKVVVETFELVSQKFNVDIQPHYKFTARNLSDWINALDSYYYPSGSVAEVFESICHEAVRIFGDRLVDQESRLQFRTILCKTIRSEWDEGLKPDFGVIFKIHAEQGALLSKASLEDCLSSYKSAIVNFERDSLRFDLVLNEETIEILASIERALLKDGGSLLLATRPGVHASTMVELISHSMAMHVFSPSVLRLFNAKNFYTEFKSVIQRVAVQKESCVILVEDWKLADDLLVLEAVNSLLSSGEFPILFSNEDMDSIFEALKDDHASEGFDGSLYDFFASRVKAKLHLVICYDTDSPDFISNCQANPAIYSNCEFVWKSSWSPETESQIVRRCMENVSGLTKDSDNLKVEELLMRVWGLFKRKFNTSRYLVELSHNFGGIFEVKGSSLRKKKQYLDVGLSKLHSASQYVDKLSADAHTQTKELEVKQSQADAALKKITESMVNAADQKREMEELSSRLGDEETKLTTQKDKIEEELAEVEPILMSAKSAVGEIRQESLSEIRSLRAPPAAIRDVLEGVLRLMGNLDMSWNSMKGFLGQRSVKDEIMNFDARRISRATRDSVQALLREKADSFDASNIKRASVAAAPLAEWVKANIQYSLVVERIAPLENVLKNLSASLQNARDRVDTLKHELSLVDKNVASLKEEFGLKTGEAESLKANLERTFKILTSSKNLLEKLVGEKSRWEEQVHAIDVALSDLPITSVVSASMVTFYGGLPEDDRKEITQQLLKAMQVKEFSLKSLLCSEKQFSEWKAEGLPRDTLSLENAIYISNQHSIPLLVDPSGQGVAWLENTLQHKKPEVIKQSDENLQRSIELAVRFGKTIIIKEVLKIERFLYPVLRKDLRAQGPRYAVQIGDKLVDYNDEFRIILVSKLSRFNMPSDLAGYINMINFTVTRAGLAGRLQELTILHERPQLEDECVKSLSKQEDLKQQIVALEELLLKELSTAEGNILENSSLIQSLNDTKSKSQIIQISLIESQDLQRTIEEQRNKFLAFAQAGSAAYFALKETQKLSHMYQFSLDHFVAIVRAVLQNYHGPDNEPLEIRMENLFYSLLQETYKRMARSLFNADRLALALNLVRSQFGNSFLDGEWAHFTGHITNAADDTIKVPSWVPEKRVTAFAQLLRSSPSMSANGQIGDTAKWTAWMSSSNCERQWADSVLSPFQRVLLVQALRPDRLLSALTSFVTEYLMMKSLVLPTLNMKQLFENETHCTQPTLFIITPGADPSDEIKQNALAFVGEDKFVQISMGQGQGDVAIQAIHDMATKGGWICLQNLHLVIDWVSTLEKELESVPSNPGFRLWLTTETHEKFPSGFLKKCLKITTESPPGIKPNLRRIYQGWSSEFIEKGSLGRAQALFALAWFHTIIQERRNFMPQGWTKFYEFSAADLRSTADLVTKILGRGVSKDSWDGIHGMLGSAIYGGKIDVPQDSQILETYIRQIFNGDLIRTGDKLNSKKLGKGIELPNSTNRNAFIQVIETLNDADNITLLGLPANVDSMQQQVQSSNVISQLKIMQQSSLLELSSMQTHHWATELTPYLKLWKSLSEGMKTSKAPQTPPPESDPLSSFFSQEISLGKSLFGLIQSHMSSIADVVKGTTLMRNEIRKISAAIAQGLTPSAWQNVWQGSDNVRVYLKNVIAQLESVIDLQGRLANGALFKGPISFAQLFRPVTLINALRQKASRSSKMSLDSLSLASSWTSSDIPKEYIVLQVDGISIQGCKFDGARTSPVESHDAVTAAVPVCYMAWIPTSELSTYKVNKIFVPLYDNLNREEIVARILVPASVEEASKLILANVALFVQAD